MADEIGAHYDRIQVRSSEAWDRYRRARDKLNAARDADEPADVLYVLRVEASRLWEDAVKAGDTGD